MPCWLRLCFKVYFKRDCSAAAGARCVAADMCCAAAAQHDGRTPSQIPLRLPGHPWASADTPA